MDTKLNMGILLLLTPVFDGPVTVNQQVGTPTHVPAEDRGNDVLATFDDLSSRNILDIPWSPCYFLASAPASSPHSLRTITQSHGFSTPWMATHARPSLPDELRKVIAGALTFFLTKLTRSQDLTAVLGSLLLLVGLSGRVVIERILGLLLNRSRRKRSLLFLTVGLQRRSQNAVLGFVFSAAHPHT
jgi:hypothetical protein